MTGARPGRRDRHLPVQRHRGLDPARAARRHAARTARSASAIARSCAARSRRTTASSRAPRATRSSSSSRVPGRRVAAAVEAQRGARRRALAGGRAGPRPDGPPHGRGASMRRRQPRRPRHQPGGPDRGRRPTAARSSSRTRPGRSSDGRCRTGSRCVTSASTACSDLAMPERLAQVDADGLPHEFPSLRSLDARPNNLPTQLTTFVGRERELAEAADLLRSTRLLTLTGPGRDGQDAAVPAGRRDDRRRLSRWRLVRRPRRRPRSDDGRPAIARTLGLADDAVRSTVDAVVDRIGEDHVLLVLDNFEQVVDAGPIDRGPAAPLPEPVGARHDRASRCASPASRSTRCRACRPRPIRATCPRWSA